MTASIVGFVTRAQAGLRPPISVSHNITPQSGGVAVHYGGDGGPAPDHPGCLARWKAWQNYHMDVHGWMDIAYNFGYCDHGYAFAGRGVGVRSAAQGSDDGNQRFYACVWIGGGTAHASPLAINALEWLIVQARLTGSAGLEVRPHRTFYNTDCPGDYLASLVPQYDGKEIGTPTPAPKPPAPTPTPQPTYLKFPLPAGDWYGVDDKTLHSHSGARVADRPIISKIQAEVLALPDGVFGPKTQAKVKEFQWRHQLSTDGRVGPLTWAALKLR